MLPRTLLLAAVLASGLTTPAWAVWSPLAPISKTGATRPLVTPAAGGAAHVVYGEGRRIARTTVAPDGARSATRRATAAAAAVGVDARGRALLVRVLRGRVVVQRVTAAGRLHRAVAVSQAGARASAPQIAVSPFGHAVVAWTQYRGRTPFRVAVAAGSVASGVRRVGFADRRGSSATRAAVAVNRRGDALVAFAQDGVVKVVERRRNRRLGAPRALGGEAWTAGRPNLEVALRADGAAVVAWQKALDSGEGAPESFPIYAATRAAGGQWSAAATLDPSGPWYGAQPDVALAERGEAIVAWTSVDPDGRSTAKVATGVPGAELRIQRLGPGTASGPIAVAGEPSGALAAVWTEAGGGDVHAAVRRPGGVFSSQQLHGGTTPVPHVAVGAAGERFVVALQLGHFDSRVLLGRWTPGGSGD